MNRLVIIGNGFDLSFRTQREISSCDSSFVGMTIF